MDYSSLEVSWKKCIEILRTLEDRYDSARRCLATLEVFHDQIISTNEGRSSRFHGRWDRVNLYLGGKDTGDNVMEDQDDDHLLHFNRSAVWGAEINFDWFEEHPLWTTDDAI